VLHGVGLGVERSWRLGRGSGVGRGLAESCYVAAAGAAGGSAVWRLRRAEREARGEKRGERKAAARGKQGSDGGRLAGEEGARTLGLGAGALRDVGP
jgi:hypothetical protein